MPCDANALAKSVCGCRCKSNASFLRHAYTRRDDTIRINNATFSTERIRVMDARYFCYKYVCRFMGFSEGVVRKSKQPSS